MGIAVADAPLGETLRRKVPGLGPGGPAIFPAFFWQVGCISRGPAIQGPFFWQVAGGGHSEADQNS